MTNKNHPCANCSFYEQSLWRPVAGANMSTLARNFTRREMEAGSVLYHQGAPSDGVYCVSRGLFAIRSFGPDGSSSLLRLAYPGELIGYRAFLTGRDHRTEAQALLPSRVCVVAQRDAKQVVRACPEVLTRLAVRCADELDLCHDRIQEAARSPNKERLAQLLEQLMAAHGTKDGRFERMHLPISRQDLADILGVQPETLSRLIKRLQSEGRLRTSGRWIEMPGPMQKHVI
ncbi:Crp/Fnr family transcriptional regulator [Antarcticimicrobium sediminis]|uniref:Crp/Fnr family transcriptional regulator n=1 Tax=Antarcticimicrobium sediminis TaxID=2546227 RepID=A0A4R5F166_9RHOB|nr:Crp/Fnr family transcriptional regulator [Antarcticimicrobium sediminis]TDE41109.1 Crp/Fnr family transcriptional regulator [Antarcticimicrobium sediminis]